MKKIFFALTVTCCCCVVTAQQQPVKIIERPVLVNKTIKTLPATYDFSNVKMCIDIKPAANSNLQPRLSSAGPAIPKIKSDGSLLQVGVIQQGLAGATEKMWNPGDVITVYLDPNNGSDWIRNRVQHYAKEWEQYANIKFSFVTDFTAAKIKVGFYSTNQSWSWIGRDVLYNPFKDYTMNFGWFDGSTFETEFSRVILHEFGHALGLLHEHQSPASPLQWDFPKAYAYFKEKNKWSEAEVINNVINRYSQNNTIFSSYDQNSIMHYFVPKGLLLNEPGGFGGSYLLSGTDITYIKSWYPFPPAGKNTTGNLRTNDDCDDVAFNVEYNAMAADMVEFTIQLGETNGKKVSWWKQIGIPRTNNTETNLWVQNFSLIANENRTTFTIQIPFSEIDMNKGISFWKAKMLGVHTLLNYKWNVLPAVKGGCRITLVWNKDACI